jgi:hypothetical protein
MVPSMLELIFFYILEIFIQGYDSHFVCARVMVFSGVRQQIFAGTGHLPPANILGFLAKKKDPVFSPAAADETLHALQLFLKLGK